ncbi:hypothetical protein O3P69_002601 [Scylla paramamosain]|uniref:(S)-2-hydroxy-acid oxidase n=1 Tax=Scylla paramamosain TaxID=85552 RepID=A0AAW0UM34_SCYPA
MCQSAVWPPPCWVTRLLYHLEWPQQPCSGWLILMGKWPQHEVSQHCQPCNLFSYYMFVSHVHSLIVLIYTHLFTLATYTYVFHRKQRASSLRMASNFSILHSSLHSCILGNTFPTAAGRIGAPFTLSTISTFSLEEVAMRAPNTLRLFQLYIYKDRELTASLVRRAEAAGFSALVLTVDAPYFGIRRADVRNQFTLPPHLRMANFQSDEAASNHLHTSDGGSGINEYVASLFDPTLTWEDVAWLKSITKLPLVLKGILTREDAILGVEAGAAAIWVSNHGARQVDGVAPTMEALPEVVEAVSDRCEVYVDSGFSQGANIFKALALGANMVFMGRPLLWGLACGGEDGAWSVLDTVRTELESTMALSGCPTVPDITRAMVVRRETRAHL